MNSPFLRALRRHLLRDVTMLLLFSGLMLQSVQAAAPGWWATQGGLDTQKQADDYAVVNLGQLKTMASKAAAEMNSSLPGGAGTAINDLIASWGAPPAEGVTRDDYAVLTIGQLKTVASLFYDRLAVAGVTEAGSYPWSGVNVDDYGLANVGQLKSVFRFEMDTGDANQNGIPDVWEMQKFGNLSQSAGGDFDGDGLSNLDEYQAGTDPANADTDGDGVSDGQEVAEGTDPNTPPSWTWTQEQLDAAAAAYEIGLQEISRSVCADNEMLGDPNSDYEINFKSFLDSDTGKEHAIWEYDYLSLVGYSATEIASGATTVHEAVDNLNLPGWDSIGATTLHDKGSVTATANSTDGVTTAKAEYRLVRRLKEGATAPVDSKGNLIKPEIKRTFLKMMTAVTNAGTILTVAGSVELAIPTNADSSSTTSGVLFPPVTTEGTCRMELVNIELDVIPADDLNDTIVPADVHEIDILATVDSDEIDIMEAEVEWTITKGSGSVSDATSTIVLDEPEAQTTLTTSTTPGDEFEVQAKLKSITIGDEDAPEEWQTFQLGDGIKEKSGTITVGPGEAGNIQFAVTGATGSGSGASMPADGMSTREITVTVTDSFGNAVAAGAPVAWRLKGDGWFTDQFAGYQCQTDANGQAHATLLAGRIPGLSQTVIVETDFQRAEYVIENTPLDFSLTPGAVIPTFAETVLVKKTFIVNASVTAADGTPIRWRTSKGQITASSSTVQDGTATATVEITQALTGGPEEGFGGLAVVTAAVAKSTAIASADLDGISLNSQTPVIEPGADPVPVDVYAPELAGQAVLITPIVSFQQQIQSFDAPALQAAAGSLSAARDASSLLTNGSFRVDVAVEQPDEGDVTGTLLEEPGVYALELNAEGQPVLRVQTSAGEDSVTLTDPAAAVVPGETRMISLSLSSSTATVSVGGYSAATPLRGPPLQGTMTVRVPEAELPRVTAVTFLWQEPVVGGALQITGLTDGALTLDADGKGTFQAALPSGFTGTNARVMVEPADGSSDVPPAQHALPVSQNDLVGPQVPEVLQEAMDLHTSVYFENRPGGSATEEQKLELKRYAVIAGVNAQASIYQSGLDKLAPLENGGELPHQAQQGKKYLEMAKKLDAAAAKIEQMVAATSAVTVTDENGKQLFSMDIADQVQKQVASAGKSAWNWVSKYLEPLAKTIDKVKNYVGESADHVVTAAGESLNAVVASVKSTETWRHAQIIAAEMDNIPLLCDAKKLVLNLTDEGMVEYLKAMWRFAKVVGKNPQAAAMYGFTELEGLIEDPLNKWARAGGEVTQVAVAAAGLLAFVVQTGAMMASTACDVGAVKRMVSQMLGTVLSAAFGSQKAKDELKEMTPFYSWLMMGEQIADLWTGKKEDGSNATDDGLPDYYGAGKKAGELIVQVIGDVTILIPVVKGASMAIKAGEKVSAVLVQALKKTTTTFAREMNPLEGLRHLDDLPKMCRSSGGCFPAGVCVVMADGTMRPIENIVVGDWVLADQPEDGIPPAPQRVSGVHHNWTEHLTLVTLAFVDGESQPSTLKSTNTHPYWVDGRGWIAAWQLNPGDRLLGADGLPRKVVSVKEQKITCDTWNLTIEDKHSFFVMQDRHSALVHNAGKGPRNYVVYTLEWTENGVKKAYTGKTGALSGGKVSDNAQRVFNKRYPGKYVKVRYDNPAYPDTPGAPKTLTKKILKDDLTNIHYREFFHDMNDEPTGVFGSNGKEKSRGDLLVEGLEQLHYNEDKKEYGSGNMYNRKAPSANANGQVERATKYMTERAGRPCPPR